ncbi:hypothetical protein KSK37_04415 [Kaistella sp. DKR-2]|uniref:hypothetical protein n=1 Tax=Kaistella soli TaxID=2849654 RepID=UPI001C253A56|nr:hypothetical protein [Kaistella soli]MBU8882324.1 hypothetical protein [Kaistella soli]
MAKLIGPEVVTGTYDGVNYYIREGEALARMAGGGFTRERILKGQNMERVKESYTEFAGCSKVNRAFKTAVKPFLSGYRDGTLHRRLMQLFLKIKDADLCSERGKRSVHQGISSPEGEALLKDFIFTPKRAALFACPYLFDRETLTFSVQGFNIHQAGFPETTSRIQVTVGVVRLDFESFAFQQVISDSFVIDRESPDASFEIALEALPEGSGLLFAVARVSFEEIVGGERVVMMSEDGVGIEVMEVWNQ